MSGSKVIGFRVPADLAVEFEQYCKGAEVTSGEVLRKFVDDLLYPDRAELDSPEHLYGVKGTEALVDLVNAQIKAQVGNMVDERLELIQIDQGLADAETREHYDEALAALRGGLAELRKGLAKLTAEVDPILTGRALKALAGKK